MTLNQVLSDAVWARIEPVLPPLKGRMGRPMRDHRLLVEAAIWRYRTGSPWRDLPAEFGPWQTAWKRHARFAEDGVWDQVLSVLLTEADTVGKLDWAVSVDSTIARAPQHATNTTREVVSHARRCAGGAPELHESAR
ncbi:MAG: IS5 family transposase [Mycobacteriaceae bacterium]